MADEFVEVAQAKVTLIPVFERGVQSDIASQLDGVTGAAGERAGDSLGTSMFSKLQDLMPDKFKNALGGLSGSVSESSESLGTTIAESLGGAFTRLLPRLSAAAIAGWLVDVGLQFEEAANNIQIGTGATGVALDSMVESTKRIMDEVPISAAQASQLIADLNTRMGLTGKTAEDLALKIAKMDKMFGSSTDVRKLTGALNAFGISGEDASDVMDTLFAISQNTGVSVNELTSIVQTNSGALMQLGFSFEQSAAMAGALDKAGIDASSAISAMGRGLVNLAKNGEAPSAALQRLIGDIQGYIAAGNESAALQLASDVFGTRQAAKMVQAIEAGTFSFENLQATATLAGEDINGTFSDTLTAQDKLAIAGNKLMVALEPLASAFADLLMLIADGISFIVELIGPAIEFVQQAFGAACEFIQSVWSAVVEFFQTAWAAITGFFQTAYDVITAGFKAVGDFFTAVWQAVVDFFSGAWNAIVGFFQSAYDGVTGVWNAVVGFFQGIWDGIVGVFRSIGDAITAPFRAAFNAIANLWNNTLGMLQWEVPDWVPFIGGNSIGVPKIPLMAYGGRVDDPTMAMLGEGGVAENVIPNNERGVKPLADMLMASMREAGVFEELVNPYAAVPVSVQPGEAPEIDASGLAQALVAAGYGDVTIPVYVGGTKFDEIVVDAINRKTYRSGGTALQ